MYKKKKSVQETDKTSKDEESEILNNELSGDIEGEREESFVTRIFTSSLNLSGLSFREKVQKILESKNHVYFLKLYFEVCLFF